MKGLSQPKARHCRQWQRQPPDICHVTATKVPRGQPLHQVRMPATHTAQQPRLTCLLAPLLPDMLLTATSVPVPAFKFFLRPGARPLYNKAHALPL